MSGAGRSLTFTLHDAAGSRDVTVGIRQLVIAGWTGRDPVAVETHIRELEHLGVARPATTPIFYRVAASQLTTADSIEAAGEHSSGEVEFVLIRHGGRRYIGVGSDHTDRKVETYNVTVSKQMCAKPLAAELWLYEDVAAHWDSLILRSWAHIEGTRTLYQEGPVTAMLGPSDLTRRYQAAGLDDGTAMFCGTLAARGGIRPARRFEFELEDPVRGRRLHHAYDIVTLPILG